jgi:hypothetical protein
MIPGANITWETVEAGTPRNLAVVVDGVVTSVVWGDPEHWQSSEGETVECPAHVGAGWRYEGGEWLEPLPPVVEEVHRAWLRAALAEAGVIAAVDAAVQAAGPVKWELWSTATTVRQADPDVQAIAGALGIDLPAIFRRADAIRTSRE